jgi:hypothetical protein
MRIPSTSVPPEPERYYVSFRRPHERHARIIPTILTPEQAERLIESLEQTGSTCWLEHVQTVETRRNKAMKAGAGS